MEFLFTNGQSWIQENVGRDFVKQMFEVILLKILHRDRNPYGPTKQYTKMLSFNGSMTWKRWTYLHARPNAAPKDGRHTHTYLMYVYIHIN